MVIGNLSRIQESLHRIEDMARIGWLEPQKIDVYVYTDDPGQIPHIHIRTYRKGSQPKKGDIDCCVMLEEARYFNHGSHQDELNFSLRKKLNDFMHSIDEDDGITYYELACKEWNRNNSDVRVKAKKDEEGNVIIPDYTAIKAYK